MVQGLMNRFFCSQQVRSSFPDRSRSLIIYACLIRVANYDYMVHNSNTSLPPPRTRVKVDPAFF